MIVGRWWPSEACTLGVAESRKGSSTRGPVASLRPGPSTYDGSQPRSKRSFSMTLVHAATKSPTNLSFASSEA